MKVKVESEKLGLKLNIQKTKTMASGSINSWQINGETLETVTDFIFSGSKSLWMVTAVMKLKDACSLKQKEPHVPASASSVSVSPMAGSGEELKSPDGRKRRETKEPLDEGERGKSWLKTRLSKS